MQIFVNLNFAASPERTFIVVAGVDGSPLSGMTLNDFEKAHIYSPSRLQYKQSYEELKIVDADALTVNWQSSDRRMTANIAVTPSKRGANVALHVLVQSESVQVRAEIEAVLLRWGKRSKAALASIS